MLNGRGVGVNVGIGVGAVNCEGWVGPRSKTHAPRRTPMTIASKTPNPDSRDAFSRVGVDWDILVFQVSPEPTKLAFNLGLPVDY